MACSPALLDAAAIVVALLILNRLFGNKPARAGPLPPGPKGLPLIGNLLYMPASHEWQTFAQWGQRWGGIVSVTILGQPYVILNSEKHAKEMLEKKSSIYSSRPVIAFGSELVGWKRILVLQPYGNTFREHRRMIFQLIGSKKNMARFVPLVDAKTRDFITEVYREPESLLKHIRKYVDPLGSFHVHWRYHPDDVLRIPDKDEGDPLVELVNRALEQFAICTAPGAFLANIFPALVHIPAWFPGAGFKKTAAAWRATLEQMCEDPYNLVKQQIAAGTNVPSFTSKNLEGDITPERELIVKDAASSLYAGGADTTVSAINSFFLAMTLHPEIQAKAHAEIEAAIGNDRLPTAEDRKNLPYVNAVFLETLRWNNVAPLGIPHRLIEDDVHDGYYLLKGTTVITNLWQMLHDPETYPDPGSFNPDRFLSYPGHEPELDPRTIAFGFGRR
ncbi:cytochrome P450 [Dichomitus squalens LYAD-421 SS1]|uniref:Cytochrome P450 n=1 Tax=Dichomitus squalens TaxID=114155 RepID=A0A4Q9PN14_9APHY|nr:cytochrome P450 [Dichomitus squalens LYAD-421 SS1]EJF64522.1 cytochrome P450 [Dichomitus squalens LYAD-421 SS1]TBU55576.1 cytochrome P450 [Dichomitus squalens]